MSLEKVKELRARADLLQAAWRPLVVEAKRLEEEWVIQKFHCASGEIVKGTRTGELFRVDSVLRFWGEDRPWLTVNWVRKNGEWSRATKALYRDDWKGVNEG